MHLISEKELIDFAEETRIYNIVTNNLHTKLAIWDIFKVPVFYKINNIGNETTFLNKDKRTNKTLLWRINTLFSLIINSIKYLLLPKNALFFYLNLRNVNNEGLYFDRDSEDTIKYLKGKKILIDSNYNNQYKKNANAYKTLSRLEPQAVKLLSLFIKCPYPEKEIEGIISVLHSTKWGKQIDNTFLYNEYKNFYLKYRYYNILFKYLKPKLIFAIQNGVQKSLFYAAKEKGIKTIEFQHGDLHRYQTLYSYPDTDNIKNMVIAPDIFLTYGDKWEKVLNMQSKVMVVGNNNILPKIYKQQSNELTIISSTINKNRTLDAIAIELSKKYPDLIINFKLHPAELKILDDVKQYFSKYQNIKVITNEISRDELFARTSSAFMICSTMAYEMLSVGINIYILKEHEHIAMEQIFKYKNVTLVNDAEDMLLKYEIDKPWGEPVSFFEPFQKETIDTILNEE